jgi:hypothetical protein
MQESILWKSLSLWHFSSLLAYQKNYQQRGVIASPGVEKKTNGESKPAVCSKGHALTWQQVNDPVCGVCKERRYSRWKCYSCKVENCVCCSAPPTSVLGKCPMGHGFVKRMLVAHQCAVCRNRVLGLGFRDDSCDFDVCMKCRT